MKRKPLVVPEPAPPPRRPMPREETLARCIETITHFDRLPDSAAISISAVAALEGISMVTAWRWMRDGLLPQPHAVGALRRIYVGELRACRAARAKRDDLLDGKPKMGRKSKSAT
jgi:predicted DNA-binding transcriptional regulator AlpA